MSTKTTNFGFIKPALTDAPPDITATNPNWDKVDELLASTKDVTLEGILTVNRASGDVDPADTTTPAVELDGTNGYKSSVNHSETMTTLRHTNTVDNTVTELRISDEQSSDVPLLTVRRVDSDENVRLGEVYSSDYKPYVIGTYTGDGKASRSISVGFQPSVVLLTTSDALGYDSANMILYGGWIFPDQPLTTTKDNVVAAEITTTGFNVKYVASTDTHGEIACNKSNQKMTYVAFR